MRIDCQKPRELPANTAWRKNSAPAQRLALIEKDIVRLEEHALSAVRRGDLSSDQKAKLMKEFSKVEREISNSRPDVPKTAPVYKKSSPREVGPGESFFDATHKEVETKLTKENYYIQRSWNRAGNQLIEVYQDVNHSLKNPGNSFKQTEGLVFKHTADEKIFKGFTALRKEWSQLTNRAYQVRKNGFSKIA